MVDQGKDPLVGLELLAVRLEPYDVHFIFPETTLQIGAPFMISGDTSAQIGKIYPAERKGNLEAAWKIVGSRVANVIWYEEKLRIEFSNYLCVEVMLSKTYNSGTIIAAGMKFEDF